MRWSEEKAMEWYAGIDWLVGFNYVTTSAVNSTEMWQPETFDEPAIRRELALAATAGYNACRVFLPFLVWHMQHESFMQNWELFLTISAEYGLFVMPVLFDDCAFADKDAYTGPQDTPVPGVHNSGWTPSPGRAIADDPSMEPALAAYVHEIIGTYATDSRIVFWDLYNEPGASAREDGCIPLLENTFRWAREVSPSQPLTACLWRFDFAAYEQLALALSDVISYHDYKNLAESEQIAQTLAQHNRPMICSEWLHRPQGNTFETHLPLFKRMKIASFHWGLVLGKTQTNLSWETMTGTPDANPDLWQHDVFHPNLRPYRPEEMAFLREITK